MRLPFRVRIIATRFRLRGVRSNTSNPPGYGHAIFVLVCFPGRAEEWVRWGGKCCVKSGIPVPKTIKIWQPMLKLQSEMSGEIFFDSRCNWFVHYRQEEEEPTVLWWDAALRNRWSAKPIAGLGLDKISLRQKYCLFIIFFSLQWRGQGVCSGGGCSGGLRAEPPVGSRGRAPGQGISEAEEFSALRRQRN